MGQGLGLKLALPWVISLPWVTTLATYLPRRCRGQQAAPWQAAQPGAATGISSVDPLPMPVHPKECCKDQSLRLCLSPGVFVT